MGETAVREQRVALPHARAATQVGHAAGAQHDRAAVGVPHGRGHPLAHLTTAQRMVTPYQHHHPAAQYDETALGFRIGGGHPGPYEAETVQPMAAGHHVAAAEWDAREQTFQFQAHAAHGSNSGVGSPEAGALLSQQQPPSPVTTPRYQEPPPSIQ
jgi:hypothetical protein